MDQLLIQPARWHEAVEVLAVDADIKLLRYGRGKHDEVKKNIFHLTNENKRLSKARLIATG